MRVGLTQHGLLDKYVNAIALSIFVKVLKKFVIQTLFDVLLSNQKCMDIFIDIYEISWKLMQTKFDSVFFILKMWNFLKNFSKHKGNLDKFSFVILLYFNFFYCYFRIIHATVRTSARVNLSFFCY